VVGGALPSSSEDALLVSDRLAERLGLRVGDRVLVPASSGADLLVARPLLAMVSLLVRIEPLAAAQPFFTLLGAASAVATWRTARRAIGDDPHADLHALSLAAFLGSYVRFSASAMKQATGFLLLPAALGLLLMGRSRVRKPGVRPRRVAPFHGVFLLVAALGIGLVLSARERAPRAFVLGLLSAVLTLAGLRSPSRPRRRFVLLAHRTVDFLVPGLAGGYGAGAAFLVARAGRWSPGFARACTAALLVLPLATLPVAFADSQRYRRLVLSPPEAKRFNWGRAVAWPWPAA
jgi:hypothetical protein